MAALGRFDCLDVVIAWWCCRLAQFASWPAGYPLPVQAGYGPAVPYLRLNARGIVSVERPARPNLAMQPAVVFGIGFVFFDNGDTSIFCPRCKNPPDRPRTNRCLVSGRCFVCCQLDIHYFLRRLIFAIGF